MRAIRVHEFGDPDVLVLEEVPPPVPVEGEVLVRIQAAGVNPFETYVRSGSYREPARAALHARRATGRRRRDAGHRARAST